MMKKLLPSLLLISSTTLSADTVRDATGQVVDCTSPMTTLEVNACMADELKTVDIELNRVYKQARAHVKKHDDEWNTVIDKRPPSIQLRDAQRLWIKQRDADCALVYALYHQGTIRTSMYIGCKTAQTEKRTKFLKSLLPR